MLRLNSVSKSFGGKKVLECLSVSFNYGVTWIAGPNGCGKTTMLKIITGLLNADSGNVTLDEQTVDAQSLSWRTKVGYLPQTIGLYNRMTIYDFLDYMLVLSNINNIKYRKERIEYLADELNLTGYLKTPCGNLSGGVKQRTAIAQAFIHNPQIVFLDEPANNLDVEERERLHNYLNKIKHDKIILYIGHILDELGLISDKVIIFKNGRLCFEGTPFDLIQLPGCTVKQILLTDNNFPSEIKPQNILRKGEESGKLKIIYKAETNDQPGVIIVPGFEDAYKILTRS